MHCILIYWSIGMKYMSFWKIFVCFNERVHPRFCSSNRLGAISYRKWLVQPGQKKDFLYTLRLHCILIYWSIGMKYMSFWKLFVCSFEWDHPRFCSSNRLGAISFRRWLVQPGQKRFFSYFENALYPHLLINRNEIYELLKAFCMLFRMRPSPLL